MAYNLFGPALTLTPDERAAEAKRLLEILSRETDEDLKRRLTPAALKFLQEKWVEESFGGVGVAVTEGQLLYLRDIKSRFD